MSVNLTDIELFGYLGEKLPVKGWVPTYQSALLAAVSSVSSVSSTSPVELEYMGEKITATTHSKDEIKLSLADRKLFDFILCWLCRFSSQDPDLDVNKSILFMLDEYLEVMGLSKEHGNQGRYYDQIMAGLEKWGQIGLTDGVTIVDSILSKRGPLSNTSLSKNLNSAERLEAIRSDVIDGRACIGVVFNPCVVSHIERIGRLLMPHYVGLFRLVEQNENAYSIAKFLLLHYASNIRNKGPRVVQVGDLLNVCPEMRSVRNDNIRKRFEAAMNALSRTDKVMKGGIPVPPLIKWEYKQKVKNAPFKKWKRLEIQYELVGYSHDDNRLGSLIKKTKALEFAGNKIIDV